MSKIKNEDKEMSGRIEVIGIDVSKGTLDLGFLDGGDWFHAQVSNDMNGHKKVIDLTTAVSVPTYYVMEATGAYYLRLAMYLHENGRKVFVVNPLVIKRFSQMKFLRSKTDKKDSKTIAEYGLQNVSSLREWRPSERVITDIQQLFGAIKLIQKQIRQTKNLLEAYTSSGVLSRSLARSLTSTVKDLEKKLKGLEGELEALSEAHYSSTLEKLRSIPGIGKKTAIMLTVLSNNFKKFDNYKQLIAYVGFSPRIYQSGTSVRGKGHICKMGRSDIRKLLYMCSWSAKKYNKSCIEMYDRLKAKGKPERVIKIALANKLLKQAFALIKNDRMYDENYRSRLTVPMTTH